jgi:hypothetical protein
MPRPIGLLLIWLSIMLMSGCTSKGEVRLDEEVALVGTGKALLKTDSENNHRFAVLLDQRVFITQLDGKNMYRMGSTTDYPQALLIEPGKHSVAARYLNNTAGSVWVTFANSLLTFDAEAEKRYVIRKEIVGGSIRFWIEDMATGDVVARPVIGGASQ